MMFSLQLCLWEAGQRTCDSDIRPGVAWPCLHNGKTEEYKGSEYFLKISIHVIIEYAVKLSCSVMTNTENKNYLNTLNYKK